MVSEKKPGALLRARRGAARRPLAVFAMTAEGRGKRDEVQGGSESPVTEFIRVHFWAKVHLNQFSGYDVNNFFCDFSAWTQGFLF